MWIVQWLMMSYGAKIPMVLKALVVAGWWGGGAWGWWGGGAWSLLYDSAFSITAQAYTVTIGGWWAWSTADTIRWSNGSNSIFSTLTATGWGWGGCNWWKAQRDWASWGSWGGWGWADGSTNWNWWSGTTWWNNWGNASKSATVYWWWWGWGAGSVGTAGSWSSGWNWWIGLSYNISGSSIYYAGWWWGSTYNSAAVWSGWLWGWGGGAPSNTPATNGTANTWGWGGWGRRNSDGTINPSGWAGWSWIVILSYATDWSDGISPSSTGGTKTTSWGQTIHTFTSSWTFTAM